MDEETEASKIQSCKAIKQQNLATVPNNMLLLFSCSVMSDSIATLWTVAHQDPQTLGLLRQEYWSGLLFPPPGGLPDPGMEPVSPSLAGRFFATEPPGRFIWWLIHPQSDPQEKVISIMWSS